jgi:ferredoxin-type protein NapF
MGGERALAAQRRPGRYHRVRLTVQALSAVAFLLCFGLATAGLTGLIPVNLFFLADPLLAGTGSLAARQLLAWPLIISGGILLLTLVGGRLFCGYVCPLGICLDWTSPRRRKELTELRGHWIKHALLVVLLVTAAFGLPAAYLFDPLAILWQSLTLVVYPFTLWAADLGVGGLRTVLDPILATTPLAVAVPQRFFAGAWFSLSLLGAILVLNRVVPRFWCRFVCPLGALLALVGRYPVLQRRSAVSSCVDCRQCRPACPMGALSGHPESPTPGECLLCLRCAEECPQRAIRVEVRCPGWVRRRLSWASNDLLADPALTRRQLLGSAAYGLGGAFLVGRLGPAAADVPDVLRPPGAAGEGEFLRLCLRCGVCMQACPTNVLQPDLLPEHFDGFFAPKLVPRLGPCDPDCNLCGIVCPSQAIRFHPLDEKRRLVIGQAVLERRGCLRAEGEDCRICIEACPFEAIDLRPDGDGLWPVVSASRCNGCGLCEFRCPVAAEISPFRSRAAIRVRPATGAPRALPPEVDIPDESYLPPFLRSPEKEPTS